MYSLSPKSSFLFLVQRNTNLRRQWALENSIAFLNLKRLRKQKNSGLPDRKKPAIPYYYKINFE